MTKPNAKNTATIQDMIAKKIVHVGDGIQFTFKGNTFYAKILRGGLIGDCKIRRTYSQEIIVLDRFVSAFSSLTAWTEAMLQDVLEEYYTRYSSWKRVTHSSTKRTMSDLRDLCKIHLKNYMKEEHIELYKEILYLNDVIRRLQNNGSEHSLNIVGTTFDPPRAKKNSCAPPRKKRRRKDTKLMNKTQDMMLNKN